MPDRSAASDRGRRTTLRLVVPSPDGRRVLARPNGLAGWALPQIAVDAPFRGWDESATAAASAVLATTVEPGEPITDGAWIVRVERIGAAGNTWIGEHELDRLGSDAGVARAWFALRSTTGDGPEG